MLQIFGIIIWIIILLGLFLGAIAFLIEGGFDKNWKQLAAGIACLLLASLGTAWSLSQIGPDTRLQEAKKICEAVEGRKYIYVGGKYATYQCVEP